MVILPTGPQTEALIQTPTFFTLTIQNLFPPAALYTQMHTCSPRWMHYYRGSKWWTRLYLCLLMSKQNKTTISRLKWLFKSSLGSQDIHRSLRKTTSEDLGRYSFNHLAYKHFSNSAHLVHHFILLLCFLCSYTLKGFRFRPSSLTELLPVCPELNQNQRVIFIFFLPHNCKHR